MRFYFIVELEKVARGLGLCGCTPGKNQNRHGGQAKLPTCTVSQDAYSVQKKPLGEGSFGSAFRATCKPSRQSFSKAPGKGLTPGC